MPETDESVRPEGYLPRVTDAKVDLFLCVFGAVEIAGTKRRGKTWTALEHAGSVSYVDTSPPLAREYLRLLRRESMPRLGRSGDVAQRLLFSLARNLGQAATYRTLTDDMANSSSEGGVAEKTLTDYLDLLRAMYLLEEVPGWLPPARSPKRVRLKPRRYLADPSLAVAVLGMSPDSLLADWQTFGLVFENLCVRDLMVYADALEGAADVPVRYYRDDAGLEADAIIELADGRWAALEIKTSEAKVPEGVRSLERMRAKLCDNPAARTRPPPSSWLWSPAWRSTPAARPRACTSSPSPRCGPRGLALPAAPPSRGAPRAARRDVRDARPRGCYDAPTQAYCATPPRPPHGRAGGPTRPGTRAERVSSFLSAFFAPPPQATKGYVCVVARHRRAGLLRTSLRLV